MYKLRLTMLAAYIANALLINAQNVGIGVERPGSKLSVKGGISIGETYAEKSAPNGSMLVEKSMGIGTDVIDTNVVLDIRSTTKGVLFPTMNTAARNSILNPPKGLFVFNEDSSGFNFYNGASWLNFALLGPTGPVGAAASLLGLGASQAGGYAATSVSASTIGTGTKVFVTQTGLAYRANDRVRISMASNKYMEGVVTTYLAGVLTVNVDRVVGSGSSISWAIGLAGDVGATGAAGAVGPQGPTGTAGAQGIQGVAGAAGARGATGATGITGAQGIQGIAGTAGAVGPQGPAGPQGLAGAAGSNGTTWLTGSGAPSSSSGTINDFYLNSSNGTYYKKTAASTWTSQGSLKGATGAAGSNGANGAVGAQGPAGANGAAGINGATWLTGSGAPSSSSGTINDFYLNSSNGTYYKKTAASTWTSQGSLKGATGAAGANGTNGAVGAQGPAGPAGAAGSNGTAWLTGNAAPGSGVGNINDLFLNSSNGTYYKKTNATTWASQGSLKGPAGSLANGSAAGNTPYWNGSSWIVNNSNIYNNGANVGIGTATPGHKLEVMNGNLSIDNTNNSAGLLVMYEPSSSGTNFTAFKARAQTADITYSLPSSQTANTMLLNDGSGNLSWAPVNQQVISMFQRKTANQSSTSSSFVDDNDFTYTLEANQTYEISGLIRIGAHKDGEWKMQFSAPTNSQTLISMAYNTEYLDEMIWITAPNTTYYMLGEGADPNADVVFVNGTVTTGNTAGTFKFKWAQKNTYATATTIYANSYIRLTRVE